VNNHSFSIIRGISVIRGQPPFRSSEIICVNLCSSVAKTYSP